MNTVFIVLDTVRKDRISVYNNTIKILLRILKILQIMQPFSMMRFLRLHGLYLLMRQFSQDSILGSITQQQQQLYLDTDKELLAEKFENEGYTTACYTSNTWINPYTGMAEGFQDVDNFFGAMPNNMMSEKTEKIWRWMNTGKAEWMMNKLIQVGEKIHWMTAGMNASTKTPRVIEKAENFIEDNRDEDFFLFLNFMDAHLPYYPPEEYKNKHAPDVEPKEICQEAHNHNGGTDEADFEASAKLYDAEIDYLDDQPAWKAFRFLRGTESRGRHSICCNCRPR